MMNPVRIEGSASAALKIAAKISLGFGGGHDTYAGAQIPIPADGTTAEAFYEVIRRRFLKAVRAKRSLTRPLTLPPDASAPAGTERRSSRRGPRPPASPTAGDLP